MTCMSHATSYFPHNSHSANKNESKYKLQRLEAGGVVEISTQIKRFFYLVPLTDCYLILG